MDRLFLAVFLFSIHLTSYSEPRVCREAQSCRSNFLVEGEDFVRIYSSQKLAQRNAQITRAVIVVHGTLRNGDEYFEDMMKAASEAGALDRTLIVAPSFKRSDDKKEGRELYWGRHWKQKWKYGYQSEGPKTEVSSFTVMDKLIEAVSSPEVFPNLKTIVLTGHSAGGQYVQRYAVASTIDKRVEVGIHYAPSNPSSYLFLTPDRLVFENGNFEKLAKPSENCEEYNNYIYGLERRNRYLSRLTKSELLVNFTAKRVSYFQGEQDKGTDYLDRSCEANLQGKNRYERGLNFYMALEQLMGISSHQFVAVPGVGHDHLKMFMSTQGQQLLFGEKSEKSFEYYRVGSNKNITRDSQTMYMLMGGSKNVAPAFERFLRAANGGDVVVLSAKRPVKQTYNLYFQSLAAERKIPLNSIKTLVLNERSASSDEFVLKTVRNAEAVFFTGGDQSRYINRIKGTPLHEVIKMKVMQGMPVSGTSAGLAVMGQFVFDAKNDTVYSEDVLRDPFHRRVSLTKGFLGLRILKNVITDTHFAERDRMGRLLVFMARVQRDFNKSKIFGVGVNEGTAIVIDRDGVGRVHGQSYAYVVSASETADELKRGHPISMSGFNVLRLNGASNFDFHQMTGELGKSYSIDIRKGRMKSSTGSAY